MVLAFPNRSAVLERIGFVFQNRLPVRETDKYSHLKMVTAVGVVMGLHAAYEIFIGGTQVDLARYLDLSAGIPAVHQLHGHGLYRPAVY